MQIGSALNTGVNGVKKGIQEMNVTADKIVKITNPVEQGESNLSDFAKEAANLNLYEKQVEASVKVVKAADQNLGTLLDINA